MKTCSKYSFNAHNNEISEITELRRETARRTQKVRNLRNPEAGT